MLFVSFEFRVGIEFTISANQGTKVDEVRIRSTLLDRRIKQTPIHCAPDENKNCRRLFFWLLLFNSRLCTYPNAI